MIDGAWITIPTAARMLGYDPDHFRRTFCNPADPVAGVGLLIVDRPGKYRRILVLRVDIERLVVTMKAS